MSSPRPSTAARQISFKLALALPVGRGEAYLGWTDEPDASPHALTLYFDDGESLRFALDASEAILIRTPKPQDPTHRGERTGGGFVIWIPVHKRKGQSTAILNKQAADPTKARPLASLDDQAADAAKVPLLTPDRVIAHTDLVEAYGFALAALARSQRDSKLAKLLEAPLATLATRRGNAFGAIEQAWHVAGYLLVIARLACEPQRVEKLQYQAGRGGARDISAQVRRFPLPTHQYANGTPAAGHITGLCFLLPLSELPSGAAALLVSVAELGELSLPLRPLETQLEALPDILLSRPQVIPVLLETLSKQLRVAAARRQLAVLARQCFDGLWPRTTRHQQYGDVCALGISGAYALDEQGIVIFGTLARAEGAALKVYLHAEEMAPVDVTALTTFLPIDGDLTPLLEKFPASGRNVSFFVHAPLATKGGERRLLRFVMPGVPDLWVRAETRALQEQGNALVHAMLGHLPRSAWLFRYFPVVCERGLGRVLAFAEAGRPGEGEEARIHEFGVKPSKPWLSIIVPLRDGCDAIRHQLAEFCDDPDFRSGVDLIYVNDNPEHEIAALDLAAHVGPLFQIPLRVITYGSSRGFAGACNAAAAMARSPLLLVMDSGVVPQQAGWLKNLCRAAEKLPNCGMVAPLLENPDGSVQHAGMEPATQPNGLPAHRHPGNGLAWEGGHKPVEQALLNASCLLLRKRDYDALGGFNPGYFESEFAGGDLSLRMSATRKRLYLVPSVRLWHLEGAALRGVKHDRRLLGLYDAWRYRKQLAAGLSRKSRLQKAG